MSMDMFGLDEDPELEPELEPEEQSDDEDVTPAPRTIDAATWAARGIVVLTLGLVAVVGGLFLGVSVTDSTPSSARPSATTSSTTAPEPTATETEAPIARVNAPNVKISSVGPGSVVGTATARAVSVPTRAATMAPTSAAPSPTSTATPRGKSANTGKPKPTKP